MGDKTSCGQSRRKRLAMSVSPAEEPPTPLSQDEHSQKVVATINSLCSDPETILNCPFCNLEIRDKSPTWSIAYSHFLDSHSLHIDRISKIVDLKEYARLDSGSWFACSELQSALKIGKLTSTLYSSQIP